MASLHPLFFPPRRSLSLIASGLYLVSATCCGSDAIAHPLSAGPSSGWTLTWSDEFSSADGTVPDPAKWTYDLGGNGWGKHELESYTSRPEKVQIQNGNLVITARRETFTGPDGISRNYTSARFKTQNLFAQAYGRFEARIKIPKGQGLWPAFWALGNDITLRGWPKCGEIDIMENIGREPGINHASLHGPSSVEHFRFDRHNVVAHRPEPCRRLSHLRRRVGTGHHALLR